MAGSRFCIFLLSFVLAFSSQLFARSCSKNYSGSNYIDSYGNASVEKTSTGCRIYRGSTSASVELPSGYDVSECTWSCSFYGGGGYRDAARIDYTCCDEACLLDSISCNGIWDSDDCECGDGCINERSQCESRGGTFHGSYSRVNNCCQGECDLCTSAEQQRLADSYRTICCAAGLAFPDMTDVCLSEGVGACGIDYSTVCPTYAPCDCVGPEDLNFNSLRQKCYDESSSSTGGSSSGGSSDSGSSGSQSSSSGNGEDWEYDYRDSLHKIIVNTSSTSKGITDLMQCFALGLCKDDLTPVINSIEGVGDSVHNVRVVIKDSTHKIIDILTGIRDKDGNTDTITSAIGSAASGIVDAMSAEAEQIGIKIEGVAAAIEVSSESLLVHLDSIWKSLKPDIQDSILKYQKYASDNFDSVILGMGKGFGLIDSLIDSTVKYFQGIATTLDTMSFDIELDSGLFTSDTTINPTVRNIDSVLQSIKDTSLYEISSEIQYLQDTVNSLKPFLSAIGDSVGDMKGSVTGAIDGLGDSIGVATGMLKRLLDSVSKYGNGLSDVGDSVGGVRGAVNALGDSMSGWWNGNGKTGLDTSGNGVGTSMDGVINGTSVDADSGAIGSIVDAGINDPSLHYGPGGVFDTSRTGVAGDTVPDSVYSLPSLDSVKTILEESVNRDYDSAEAKYKAYFDTLRDEMQLIDWDSVILSPLAAKVPNTNTCPAECFAVRSTGAPSIYGNFNYNFGLCTSWPVLGGMNVLLFVRLILRIVTAVLCVYIGAWFIAGRK